MNSDRDRKMMLCGYCQHRAEANSKCDECMRNPGFKDNFELGADARKMIEEGVLTRYGAISVVDRLNTSSFNRIKSLFSDIAAVDPRDGADVDDAAGGAPLDPEGEAT